jgi:adenine/guanine phosphoribosyltransferase-like PRPP-binding protein
MYLLEVSGWGIGALGIALSVYYGQKAEALKRTVKTVDWPDIEAGTSYLAQELARDNLPAALFSTDARGGILAKMISGRLGHSVPVFVGLCFEREKGMESFDGYFRFETEKWSYFLPIALKKHKGEEVVFVDDVVFSGHTLTAMKLLLSNLGFEKLRSASLLVSEIAAIQGLAPDLRWKTTPHSEIYFPWGRMR